METFESVVSVTYARTALFRFSSATRGRFARPGLGCGPSMDRFTGTESVGITQGPAGRASVCI
jgi:hypothetical protein